MPKSCIAVVVLFHPDFALTDRLWALLAQFEQVVLVDNGSADFELEPIRDWLVKNAFGRHKWVYNHGNLGVAEGFNRGAQVAMQSVADPSSGYLVFFDQDSVVTERFSVEMAATFKRQREAGKNVGVVGSSFRDLNNGIWMDPGRRLKISLGLLPEVEVGTVITSGSMVPFEVWRNLGGYWSSLFIDHVDDEFCLRAKRAGYSVLQNRLPLIEHCVGSSFPKKILWKKYHPMNQSPFRWYHVARNFLMMARRHFLFAPFWHLQAGEGLIRRFAMMLLGETNRPAKVLAAGQGFFAGLYFWITGKILPHPSLNSRQSVVE